MITKQVPTNKRKQLYLQAAINFEWYSQLSPSKHDDNKFDKCICNHLLLLNTPIESIYDEERDGNDGDPTNFVTFQMYPELRLFDDRMHPPHVLPTSYFFTHIDPEGSAIRATILLLCHEMTEE